MPGVSPLNLIDCGCHKGHFLTKFKREVNRPVYSIGIDPVNHPKESVYDKYFQMAVDNVDTPTIKKFYEYIEPGCNSLLEMNVDKVVHNRSEVGWYVGWPIEKQKNCYDVEVDSLASFLETQDYFPIHLLKIDSQGNDINVVKSLGVYVDRVAFVQMECVSSKNKEIVLYKGQQIMEQDIEDMTKLGFEVVKITDYSKEASPECDILFKNRRWNKS